VRGEWELNPQYNYGYVVPLLGLALFWWRWPERPSSLPPGNDAAPAILAASLLFLFLPLRLILEANPEWRLLYWAEGAQVAGLSFCLLYWLGGWRWTEHFAPPVLFMLIAIPWPMTWEKDIIQGLMRFVAGITVEIAGWMGIPAVQHGNLVEVGTGIIGIDEACSGVRSLQSALMLSLFLGEMNRFSLVRRTALLGASLVFVVVANIARTTFLVWTGANHGMRQLEAWHDAAGMLIMLIVLPALLGLAHLIKPRTSNNVQNDSQPACRPILPRWVGLVAIGWIGASILATEVWYRAHETGLIANVRWAVAWPDQSPQFKKTEVPKNSLAVLRCSNSEAAAWQDEDGNQWSAFVLRWNPGKNSAQLAKGHRPEICFPASGAQLVQDFGQVSLAAKGLALAFRHQSFQTAAGLTHVFYCLWSDNASPAETSLLEDESYASRFQAVMAGKRNLGQQVVEIVLQGPDSGTAAVALLKLRLPSLIQRQ